MPEITIRYNTPETLQVLKSIARYFDFAIAMPSMEKEKRPHKRRIDEITMFSEASLAEAWDSPEDERWDELYKK